MIVRFSLLVLFLICSVLNLQANDLNTITARQMSSSVIVHEKSMPAIGVTELTLANGVRVCLKPTTFDEEEVLIQGFAPGGFTAVGSAKRASAELAPAIAWASGVGALSAQQWSRNLLGSEIDLAAHVGPYDHLIEGSAPPEKLAELLRMLGALYTAPQFSSVAMSQVVERRRESLRRQAEDPERRFESAIKAINSGDLPVLRSLTDHEVAALDFPVAEAFYRHYFLNPRDLTFVVVGDFTVEEIKPLVIEHLAGIPVVEAPAVVHQDVVCPFPEEFRQTYVTAKEMRECLTRITFCIEGATKAEDLRLWEMITQVLETRLRKVFVHEVGSTQGIDVALELPLHPSCTPTWLTFQFQGSPIRTQRLVDLILREMREMQRQGPTAEDVDTAKELQSCNDSYWESDNGYWLALVSNHYRQGLRLESLRQDEVLTGATAEGIARLLRTALDLSRYTVVTLGSGKSRD